MEDLRYPVGRYQRPDTLNAAQRQAAIESIAAAPRAMRDAVRGLDDAQLDTPYRPEGWTVRQVVHHVPDSHMNAYIRMKLAATENFPTVRTYEEKDWAELPEAKAGSIAMSLDLLDALHRRWTAFLRALKDTELQRAFQHAEWGRVTIEEAMTLYSWHSRHHTAHIAQAITAMPTAKA